MTPQHTGHTKEDYRIMTELQGLMAWLYTLRNPYNVERTTSIEETTTQIRYHYMYRERQMKPNNAHYMRDSRARLVYSNKKLGYHHMIGDSIQYTDILNDYIGDYLNQQGHDRHAIRIVLQGGGMSIEEPRQGYNRERFSYTVYVNKRQLPIKKLQTYLPNLAETVYLAKQQSDRLLRVENK